MLPSGGIVGPLPAVIGGPGDRSVVGERGVVDAQAAALMTTDKRCC